jgi:hypothetical protein
MNWARGLQLADGASRAEITITAPELSIDGVGFRDVSLTANIGTDLQDGLTELASTWYSVWVESTTRGQKTRLRTLFSDVATEPTPHVYYPRFRRVGWVLNDAAFDFYQFTNEPGSDWFLWNVDETVLPFQVLSVTTSSLTPVVVPCAGAACPTADELRIVATIESGAVSVKRLRLRQNGLTNLVDPAFIGSRGQSITQVGNLECNGSQQVQYWTSNTSHDVRISVLGHRDRR